MIQKPGPPLMMNQFMPSLITGQMNVMPPSNEATLYVGNLNTGLEETRLMSIFQPYGQILSCRIMRDLYSHESRRFGFVSFSNVNDAQKAKEELNYKNIDGFEIRICFKKSPSEFKPEANVFVKNLSREVTTRELDELCDQFGKTISCSIRTDSRGNSLGYGHVQFDDEASAKRAIDSLNNMEFKGSKLEVQKFVPSKNRAASKTNLYIKNFPSNWEKARVEKELKELFEGCGKITCSGVKEHKLFTGETKFYAFVAYEDEESAKKAIDSYNGKHLDPENKKEDDEPFYVAFVQPKRIRQAQLEKEHTNYRNTTNLYIKSLKDSVTEADLMKIFGKYGKITSLVLKSTKPAFLGPTETMQFAYINYSKGDEANEAYLKGKKDPEILELLHPMHKDGLDFISYHQPKAVRMQYLRIKKRMQMAMMIPPQMGMPGLPGMRGGPFSFKKKGGRYNNPMDPFGMPRPDAFPPMPPMMPGMMPGMVPEMAVNMMPGMPLASPSTFNNTTPSNSSRPGEKKEEFNVEWLKKNKKEFLAFDKDKQNNVLGNLMYNRVLSSGLTEKDLVPKITGMLIDLDILDYEEIIDILVNEESLKDRINEAVEVIKESPAA